VENVLGTVQRVIGTTCSYACAIPARGSRLGAHMTLTSSGVGCFGSRRATLDEMLAALDTQKPVGESYGT
jgi:hypothetical protein